MLLNQALKLPIHQSEVDFVIPNLAEDLGVYVDPFLFYKSSIPEYHAVHATLRQFFSTAIDKIKHGENEIAERMMAFPEVKETMLGMSQGSHKGRGMGSKRGAIIYKEIVNNPEIQRRGISHLAEMQLLIEGVGFDLISDMCTNIAKPFFVHYTQHQCRIHNIPTEKGVRLEHVFDWDELDWDDITTELPINPITENPILLVPKAVVRTFSELNYKDFWKTIYRYILRDIEVQKSVQSIGREPKITWKEINEKYDFCKKTVTEILHEQPELLRDYVKHKEKTVPEDITPTDLRRVKGTDTDTTPVEQYIAELESIEAGKKNKADKRYEALIARILTRLFSPPLINPHSQVTTHDGREIIDITFYNAAKSGFWHDLKLQHGSLIVVFELKNMDDLANEEYFQIAARLDENRGKFGILIARKKDNLDIQRAYRRLDKERKVILTLTDEDIKQMLNDLQSGLSTTMYINQMYRKFIEEA